MKCRRREQSIRLDSKQRARHRSSEIGALVERSRILLVVVRLGSGSTSGANRWVSDFGVSLLKCAKQTRDAQSQRSILYEPSQKEKTDRARLGPSKWGGEIEMLRLANAMR